MIEALMAVLARLILSVVAFLMGVFGSGTFGSDLFHEDPEDRVAVGAPDRQVVFPLAPVRIEQDSLGTTSLEFSGITVNEALRRVLIVDDADRIFEFVLHEDGDIADSPIRTVAISAGGGDTEGIAWLYGQTYALASENTGVISIVEISDEVTKLGPTSVVHQIDTGIREDGGNGLEGVAFDHRSLAGPTDSEEARDAQSFFVVDERPPRLYRITWDGSVVSSIALDATITDASDVWVGHDGSIFVLSDESRQVVQLEIDDDLTAFTVVSTQSLIFEDGLFAQPEGLALSSDLLRLYVVGEIPSQFSYSYGYFAVQDRAR